jgi:Type II secretion system protein C
MRLIFSSFFLLKHLPTLLCAVFMGLAAALGTHFVLKTLYGVPAPAQAPAQAARLNTATTAPNWLMSGASAQASDMVLLGVVAQNTQATQGLALLQTASGERAKVYAVGQSLPNGAVLKSVSARSITLDMGNHLNTLELNLKPNTTNPAINAPTGFEGRSTMPSSMAIPDPQAAAATSTDSSKLANHRRLRANAKEAAPSLQ